MRLSPRNSLFLDTGMCACACTPGCCSRRFTARPRTSAEASSSAFWFPGALLLLFPFNRKGAANGTVRGSDSLSVALLRVQSSTPFSCEHFGASAAEGTQGQPRSPGGPPSSECMMQRVMSWLPHLSVGQL